MARFQKYRLSWPLTSAQVYNIDAMFSEIYADLNSGDLKVIVPPTPVVAGTYGSSTAIPSLTVDATGRLTHITTFPVIAPAGTLTGTVLASNVITSSLTAVGTLVNLTVTNPINGSVTGGSGSATLVAVTDDLVTNAVMYPTWVSATPGNEALKTSSTGMNWNPSTKRLTIGTSSVGSISVLGQLLIINTQTDNSTMSFAATVTMPTVITTTRSAFNFDVTTAGSSSFITQGMVFTMEAGYTGSAAVKALVVQSGVATTGFAVGVTARMVGAAGVNIGVNSFCNAGTQNIALFGGLGNTDGSLFSSGISACLVLANGTTASDLIQAYSNVTKKFSVTDAGLLTAASTIVAGGNLQAGATSYVTWNGLSAIKSPTDGTLNVTKQSTTTGVGIDVTTDAVLAVRTRAQTGDASITSLNHTTSGTLIDTSFSVSVPLTGGTVTLTTGAQRTVINPAGTLAALTVTLPASPVNGQIVGFSFTRIITALTVNAPGGATVVAAPTSAAVDSNFRFIYQTSSTSWFPAS